MNIANSSSPGCHFCLMALQPCLASISHRYGGDIRDKLVDPSLEAITPEPELREETISWLARRQYRYNDWIENERSWSFTKRRDSCAGHVSGYLYLTTGYSLDGK
jgi:hypothetical protein